MSHRAIDLHAESEIHFRHRRRSRCRRPPGRAGMEYGLRENDLGSARYDITHANASPPSLTLLSSRYSASERRTRFSLPTRSKAAQGCQSNVRHSSQILPVHSSHPAASTAYGLTPRLTQVSRKPVSPVKSLFVVLQHCAGR